MRLSAPYAPETPDFVDTPEGRKAVPERMSPTDFASFGFGEKDKWELIRGNPVMSPAPAYDHQRLLFVLAEFINRVCDSKPGLEMVQDVDVLFDRGSESDWLRPDVAVVEEAAVGNGTMPLRLVPALVVEILSPSTGGRDHGIKREIYARAGVAEYWIADPVDGSLSIRVNTQDGEYAQQPADEDGFVASPFAGLALRIQRQGRKFRMLTR